MEDNVEDQVVETTGFKEKCKKTFGKLVGSGSRSRSSSQSRSSSHSRSPSPHKNLSSSYKNSPPSQKNSPSPLRTSLSPNDNRPDNIMIGNAPSTSALSDSAIRENVMKKRSISAETYSTRPINVVRSKTVSPRVVIELSHQDIADSYSCFIVYVVDGLIRISGANYNTLDLVQSGYKGIKINNYTLEEDGKYFLVYSKTAFGISDTMFLSDTMNPDEVVIEFRKNFPMIIKSIGNKFREDSFMSVFLTIMFSIKEKKGVPIEEKEKIIESSEENLKLCGDEKDIVEEI
jgi:hypothetical protein